MAPISVHGVVGVLAFVSGSWLARLGGRNPLGECDLHPILSLELRRVRRKRWWPGRRFFLFYPALLGAALGYGLVLALSDSRNVQLLAVGTGVPALCLLGLITSFLAFVLPWIVPVLTATSVARERELGTLDLLRVTTLTSRSIVLGKLGGCLVWLWPGVLVLALLSPLVWVAGGSVWSLADFTTLMGESAPDARWPWAWLLLADLSEWIRLWGHLALHAAVGLFFSVLSRSSRMAVVASYGAIIGLRVLFSLVSSLLGLALTQIPGITSDVPGTWVTMTPSLTSLGMGFLEFAGAALLVCGATWWLEWM